MKGSLSSASHVIVDVGTGFYVEKDVKSAAQFYEDKTNEIGTNVKDLDSIIQGKTNNVRVIEEGKNSSHAWFSHECFIRGQQTNSSIFFLFI